MAYPWEDEDYKMGLRYEDERGGYATRPELYEPKRMSYADIGDVATSAGILSKLLGLSGAVAGPLAGVGVIANLVGSWYAAKKEEEMRRKQEALQRAAAMSRSYAAAGRRGY
jgi:hypothetical protein